MRHANGENGEGRFSTFVWFIVLAGVIYFAWNAGPVYIDNYSLQDKMNEIARSPRGTTTDEKIMDMLVKEAQERGLDPYISRQNFRVRTLDTSRSISCDYEREAEILPGWKRVFRFEIVVDQPLIY